MQPRPIRQRPTPADQVAPRHTGDGLGTHPRQVRRQLATGVQRLGHRPDFRGQGPDRRGPQVGRTTLRLGTPPPQVPDGDDPALAGGQLPEPPLAFAPSSACLAGGHTAIPEAGDDLPRVLCRTTAARGATCPARSVLTAAREENRAGDPSQGGSSPSITISSRSSPAGPPTRIAARHRRNHSGPGIPAVGGCQGRQVSWHRPIRRGRRPGFRPRLWPRPADAGARRRTGRAARRPAGPATTARGRRSGHSRS